MSGGEVLGLVSGIIAKSDANGAVVSVLQACTQKAAALDKIFHAVVPRTSSSRMDKYRRALQTIPKADRVESLMAGILADLQVLTFHHTVGAATKAQIEGLIAEARGSQVEELPRPVMTFRNAALGAQIVHAGNGNQNINLGQGPQINSDVLAGSFYFGYNRKPE